MKRLFCLLAIVAVLSTASAAHAQSGWTGFIWHKLKIATFTLPWNQSWQSRISFEYWNATSRFYPNLIYEEIGEQDYRMYIYSLNYSSRWNMEYLQSLLPRFKIGHKGNFAFDYLGATLFNDPNRPPDASYQGFVWTADARLKLSDALSIGLSGFGVNPYPLINAQTAIGIGLSIELAKNLYLDANIYPINLLDRSWLPPAGRMIIRYDY